jgi:predicted nucleic acid-binding protein
MVQVLMSVVYFMYRSDSSSQNTDSDFDDDWTMKSMAMMRAAQNSLLATAVVASKYFMTYHDKMVV